MCPTETQLRRLDDASSFIHDADLLLFRGSGLISIGGRGKHTHAGKAAWWGRELMCLEVREICGGRAVTLRSQVRRYPKRIEVYRTNPTGDRRYDPEKAVDYMRRLTGCDYGWRSCAIAAFTHTLLMRLLIRPSVNDRDTSNRPPFCSEACASADRIGGGIDSVLNLADRFTEPSDLARSQFYEYQFTLIP